MAVSSTVSGRQTPTRPRSQPHCQGTEPEKTEQDDRRAHHNHEIVSTQDTYSAFGSGLTPQRPENPLTLCDDHRAIFVTASGQILGSGTKIVAQ
jgi:hypothetical protein